MTITTTKVTTMDNKNLLIQMGKIILTIPTTVIIVIETIISNSNGRNHHQWNVLLIGLQ